MYKLPTISEEALEFETALQTPSKLTIEALCEKLFFINGFLIDSFKRSRKILAMVIRTSTRRCR